MKNFSTPLVLLCFLSAVGTTACFNQDDKSLPSQAPGVSPQVKTECPLPPGKYDVQSLTFQSSAGSYSIFIVGAASCVKQPVSLTAVRLARIETAGGTAKAQLEVASAEDPTLYLTENYKIEMRNAVVEGNQVVREETSSWMPFLAGAAGAAVAGVAMNAMFNKPNYYQPPPPRPGMADVRGYGSAAPNYKESVSNYQSKYNSLPQSEQPQNKNFFGPNGQAANAANNSKLNQASAAGGSQASSVKGTGSGKNSVKQKRKGFFNRRRR